MDIFYKKTEIRRCVPFNSCQPKQCKNNIPFGLARRICTVVENSKVREKKKVWMSFKKFDISKNTHKI